MCSILKVNIYKNVDIYRKKLRLRVRGCSRDKSVSKTFWGLKTSDGGGVIAQKCKQILNITGIATMFLMTQLRIN